jgi:peptide/nickel transport system substrate-binding protein
MTPRLRLSAAVFVGVGVSDAHAAPAQNPERFRSMLAVAAPLRRAVFAAALALGFATGFAHAQTPGGVLRMSHFDSPASMSLHEEATAAVNRPMMGVFNNLIMYKQDVAQNSQQSIVPDLATGWSWSEDGTELTFPLRQGVRWHDGKPFTSADVKCTWELLTGKATDKLRLNPRKQWYQNLAEVTTKGDYDVTFRLKRPQPSFLALLASGWSAVYPCHVSPREMRTHPVGTGPFKFVEFKPNELIRVAKNPDYWKPGRPYLDGIDYTIIASISTRILGFIADKFDTVNGVTVPLLKDVKAQAPQAVCEVIPSNVPRTLLVNRAVPPFDNPELRRAMALTLDRKAFIDIITLGQGDIGAAMLPAPEGVWGMPPEMLRTLPGYDPDVGKNRATARQIMEKLGYGPDKRLAVKVSVRNIVPTRDPAVILIDHLKEIYIDGTLEPVDTTNWYPKVLRRDFTVGMVVSENGLDDPDQQFYENFTCNAERNYSGYCNPDLDRLIDRQSIEPDHDKRRQLVWEIERLLAEDNVRPVIFFPRAAWCLQPRVKGMTLMVNSIYNGSRFEDTWLDK